MTDSKGNKHSTVGATAQNTGGAIAKPKSSEMTPGPGFQIRMTIARPPADLMELYRRFPTPDVSDMLNRMYTLSAKIRCLTNSNKLVGPAVTVKVFPGDNLVVHKALDVVQPGDVIVINSSGDQGNAILGDLIANKAKHRGVIGFIIDGLIRDLPGVIETGLPVFARGVTPFGPLQRGPGELNFPISCGGIVVNPGDIIVADENGIVVVRKGFAAEILERLKEHEAAMEEYVENVKRGKFSNAWVDTLLKDSDCLIHPQGTVWNDTPSPSTSALNN